jgi:hypothetical protein
MNKKQIVASLNKIANELDNSGLYNESSTVTKVMSRLAFSPDFDDPRSRGADYSFEPELREDVMQLSDVMDPEGTSNKVDDYFRHHNSITDALDEATKSMREDPMISESAMKEAEMIIQRIKKLSNELLLK